MDNRAPRVGHKKSRKGCAQCKKRHVKCDEQTPCGNCVRHGVPCSRAGGPMVVREDGKRATSQGSSGASQNASVSSDATHSSAATSDCPENSAGNQNATSSQSHQSPFTVLTGLIDRPIPGEHDESWMLDLDLLHHYLMHTNNILMGHYDTAQILRIWHEDMPKIALSSHYCMHALLGLTALHKAHVQPNIALMLRTRAVDHLDKALVLYREHGQQTTAKNANARFAFSWLVALFAYAVPPSVPPIDAMTELFLLVKGIDIVLGESWFSISQGPFAPVLAGGPQTPLITTAHKLPDGFDFGLDHLDYMLGSDIMLPDDRRTCVLILAELKQTYEFVLRQQGRCSVSSILCFPKQDSAPYSQLLKRRVPQALIILAHYCVLLDILDSRWWINGWSSNVVRDIMGSLDEQWQSWIEWPVRSVVWKSDREAHTIEPMGRL